MLNAPDKRLALQAYEQILELILGGSAKPGELVNERRLADALNMSRTPVRDALLMLEGEGLLLRQGSRGLQVKQMRIEDYMDALQVRLLLEPAVARMAAGKLPAATIAALREQIAEALAQAPGQPADRALVRDIDEGLHGAISDAVENQQLSSIIRTMRRQTQMFDLRAVPERLEDTCREHLEILDAVEAGNGEAAAQAMAAHLSRVRDSIINRLARL
ncbi:GntR family transcriptional regulator [Gemmobacter nectariphilus]|uniref:GntR family transcriptional regulator n=1 Tax=Gemmobacter nectariphilus TaxID=220343 RepID=UPI0003FEE84C|nr:GntR family transcriptional regulator [Gemmobacter nectariphilus]